MGGSVQTSNNANPAINGSVKGATPPPAASSSYTPSQSSSSNGKFADQSASTGTEIPADVMARYSGQKAPAFQTQAEAATEAADTLSGKTPQNKQTQSSAVENTVAANASAVGGPANAGAIAHAARTKFASGGTVNKLTPRDIEKILRAVTIAREVVKKDKE
jgi:hypothetical protein